MLAGGSLPSPEQFGRLTMQTELNDKATQTGLSDACRVGPE